MRKTILAITILACCAQLLAREYPDSVRQASIEQTRIYKGLCLELSGGLGTSRIDFQHWGQKSNDAFLSNHLRQNMAFPSGNAALGITYYFATSIGLGTGIEFSSYQSKTSFNAPWHFENVDRYGDTYTQTISTNAIEQEDIYMIELPIGLHFRTMGEGKRVGFIGAVGIKLGMPIKSRYQMKDVANITNSIYYPIYDLELYQIPTVIEDGVLQPYSGEFANRPIQPHHPSMTQLNYAGYAQVGALFQLTQRIDISVSAFATYYINNVIAQRGNEPIRFGQDLPIGEYPTPLSDDKQYVGWMNTNAVSSVHPWNVGLKLGFHFNTGKTESQREYDLTMREERYTTRLDNLPTPPSTDSISQIKFDSCNCIDTLYLYIHDTIYIKTEESEKETLEMEKLKIEEMKIKEAGIATSQIAKMMEKSVIWFDLDSDVPILQPEDILIRIAAILRTYPQQRIYINGHACRLGKPEYNKDLAMRRAQAVNKMLIDLGVDRNQLIVRTKGANEPYYFCGQHNLEKDRRVEIIPSEIADGLIEKGSAPPIEEDREDRQIVIKEGDRLAKLARLYYGNTDDWHLIFEANKNIINNPDILPVGKTIIIPRKQIK